MEEKIPQTRCRHYRPFVGGSSVEQQSFPNGSWMSICTSCGKTWEGKYDPRARDMEEYPDSLLVKPQVPIQVEKKETEIHTFNYSTYTLAQQKAIDGIGRIYRMDD